MPTNHTCSHARSFHKNVPIESFPAYHMVFLEDKLKTTQGVKSDTFYPSVGRIKQHFFIFLIFIHERKDWNNFMTLIQLKKCLLLLIKSKDLECWDNTTSDYESQNSNLQTEFERFVICPCLIEDSGMVSEKVKLAESQQLVPNTTWNYEARMNFETSHTGQAIISACKLGQLILWINLTKSLDA